MLAKVKSYALDGLNGYPVDVEIDINNGLPSFEMVGLASTATKESKERIRSAVKNSGFLYPIKRITINLAPADTKKEGPSFDLPLAVALLAASGQLETKKYKDYIILGELSLDGELRHINGLLPIIISSMQSGIKKFIIPKSNEKEASFIEGIESFCFENLKDVCNFLNGENVEPIKQETFESCINKTNYDVDFADVKGQAIAKRAIEIAVCGGHNIIMIGPPGAGKTMLAKCVPTIMPEMSFDEAIEVTKIHSVSGILDKNVGIVTTRPFRSPHHTSTVPALVGGGAKAKPGEVSLATHGVLFLDEMPEYSRQALETLRQPLEDRTVSISRVSKTIDYPANFMLVASMNPCPCGNYGSKTDVCRCTDAQIRRYISKLSGPLLDRIDLQIEVDNVSYDEFRSNQKAESSADIKARIDKARQIQIKRFNNDTINSNAEMKEKHLKKYCAIDQKSEKLLKMAFEKLNLSARGTSRILKVARTIADLEGVENIQAQHIAEAIQYRGLDRKYHG